MIYEVKAEDGRTTYLDFLGGDTWKKAREYVQRYMPYARNPTIREVSLQDLPPGAKIVRVSDEPIISQDPCYP
ncbi:MAG: hypothetical protein QXY45_04665 [Candidatus Aenigmatarchaeota archaeon]